MSYYGSIEAGGTKFVCAIGNEKLEVMVYLAGAIGHHYPVWSGSIRIRH